MKPRGATELQLEMLNKHVPKDLLDQFQICTSIPGKVPIDASKINILWQKNSYDQPNLQEFFGNKKNHNDYDWYVFNSHWNYEKFRYFFDIPADKSVVIKNGCTSFPQRKIYKKGDPIKILHHNTPWRGLNVVLRAMQDITDPNITLDVYSSTQVYGDDFKKNNDDQFKPLYEQAEKLPNVNYIGYKSNEYIKKHLKDYRMFVYPSIWEETSCISLLESMSAGLYCITTNYGALYETGAEFPMYIPYDSNHRAMAQKFGFGIEQASHTLDQKQIHDHLDSQSRYAHIYYNWNKIAMQWTTFLKGVINAKSQ